MKRKTTKTKKRGAAKARPAAKRVKAPSRKVAAKRSPAMSPARKTAKPKTKAGTRAKTKEVFGEGNYSASRNFDREQTEFVRKNKGRISKLGKAAERALEGPEGKGLDEAADRAKARSYAPDEEA